MNFMKRLEAWERERYERRIAFLTQQVSELKHQTEIDAAYIAGLHKGLRRRKQDRGND